METKEYNEELERAQKVHKNFRIPKHLIDRLDVYKKKFYKKNISEALIHFMDKFLPEIDKE